MKEFISKREEVANALNFGAYNVIYKDLSKCRTEYGIDLGLIKIDLGLAFFQKHGYRYIEADLYIYRDEKRLTTTSRSTVLANCFAFENLVECAEYAVAPVIDYTKPFILVLTNSSSTPKKGLVIKMSTKAKSLNRFCQTPLQFEDDEMESVLNMLDIRLENQFEEAE